MKTGKQISLKIQAEDLYNYINKFLADPLNIKLDLSKFSPDVIEFAANGIDNKEELKKNFIVNF